MENEKNEKQCLHCGETFLGVDDQKYCSTSCRVMAYRKRKEGNENESDIEPVNDENKSDIEPMNNEDYEIAENAAKYRNMASIRSFINNKSVVEIMPDKTLRVLNCDGKFAIIPISEYNLFIDEYEEYLIQLTYILDNDEYNENRDFEFEILKNAMDVSDKFHHYLTDIRVEFYGCSLPEFALAMDEILDDEKGRQITRPKFKKASAFIAKVIRDSISEGYLQKQKL